MVGDGVHAVLDGDSCSPVVRDGGAVVESAPTGNGANAGPAAVDTHCCLSQLLNSSFPLLEVRILVVALMVSGTSTSSPHILGRVFPDRR